MEQTTPAGTPDTAATESGSAVPSSHAWRRYFARGVDTTLVMGVVVFVLLMFSLIVVVIVDRPGFQAYAAWVNGLAKMNRFLDTILTIVLWLPIEALLLSTLGTTPGKWIFGIRVRTRAGNLLRYWTALSRAARVFFQGMALSIPFLSLITLFVSYDRLVKTGSTPWDRDLKANVGYAKMTELRLAGCIVAAIIWAGVTGWSLMRYLLKT
ncbi:MAG TPA: RDD family protein [Terracidiphilus sp.]|nr:RDD family protein [Terracidiphilus sp.]